MTQGLVLYDASARIVTFNQRYIDMYSLSTDVVKPGLHYYDLIQHRKDTGSYRRRRPRLLRPDHAQRLAGQDQQHDHGDAATGAPISSSTSRSPTGGWVATIEDITDRRKLEQERDRNHAFLREIIDHIPTQITVKDARDRRYVLVNSVAEEQFGASSEDIVGKTPVRPVSEGDRRQDHRRRRPRAAIRATRCSSTNIAGKAGRWATAIITSKRIAIRDKAGEPRYILNVVEDVTERRARRREDRASGALRCAHRPAEPGAVPRADRARAEQGRRRATSSRCSTSTSTNSRASTTRSAIMSATSC